MWSIIKEIYEGRLKSSWTQLIPSRHFVEVWWRSLLRSTCLGKRSISYNATPTSRKVTADRWSLAISCLGAPFSWLEKPRNRKGRDLNWILYSAWKMWQLSGIALGYVLDNRGSRFRFPAGAWNFFFATASRTTLGPTQSPIQWVPGALFLGV
jgi:hypothetical protein